MENVASTPISAARFLSATDPDLRSLASAVVNGPDSVPRAVTAAVAPAAAAEARGSPAAVPVTASSAAAPVTASSAATPATASSAATPATASSAATPATAHTVAGAATPLARATPAMCPERQHVDCPPRDPSRRHRAARVPSSETWMLSRDRKLCSIMTLCGLQCAHAFRIVPNWGDGQPSSLVRMGLRGGGGGGGRLRRASALLQQLHEAAHTGSCTARVG